MPAPLLLATPARGVPQNDEDHGSDEGDRPGQPKAISSSGFSGSMGDPPDMRGKKATRTREAMKLLPRPSWLRRTSTSSSRVMHVSIGTENIPVGRLPRGARSVRRGGPSAASAVVTTHPLERKVIRRPCGQRAGEPSSRVRPRDSRQSTPFPALLERWSQMWSSDKKRRSCSPD